MLPSQKYEINHDRKPRWKYSHCSGGNPGENILTAQERGKDLQNGFEIYLLRGNHFLYYLIILPFSKRGQR